ncbi:MAG TPA: cysteine desulfurase family protein [Mycobacteriales bacterium]|jgi:cysteine desulfurase|nr:cysteine desulfurase family protein [Mycobacteriales bacterium]
MNYLDHAATTPMLPCAIAAMGEQLGRIGNPSSLHGSGRQARRVVEESRELIAERYGAAPAEVVLTAGGTEGDNLAVKGLYWARRAADPRRRRLLVSGVEHHAVLDAAQWLADRQDAVVEWLPVDRAGRVEPETLTRALAAADDVALVSVMWANNEVGTIEPIAELVEIAHAHGVPFHSDAVQAAGVLPLDFAASGVDALTLSGHKLGGPVGVGALLLRRDATLEAVLHGGGQERDVRSGTLDVAGAAGFAAAVREATAHRDDHVRQLTALRDDLVAGIRRAVPDVVVNAETVDRLPGIAHVTFPGCEGDAVLMLLDAAGVECSTGSACSAGVARASHVLLAMGVAEPEARASLRFSFGHTSTDDDVVAAVEAIGPAVGRARQAGAQLAGSGR